jgi:hypothetical protein
MSNDLRNFYIQAYTSQYPTLKKVWIEHLVDTYMQCPDKFKEIVKRDQIKTRKGASLKAGQGEAGHGEAPLEYKGNIEIEKCATTVEVSNYEVDPPSA